MRDLVVSSVNVLSLCTGGGGLDLGIRLAAPRARVICYVEREAYAAAVLAARIADDVLDDAPIWSDLTTFDGRPWRGVVDCVIAGFPCQPWSPAGKRRGTADERWIWPDIARIVREVGPRIVFLENVPQLVAGGLEHVLRDLAESGFDAEWDCFSAAQVGLPHIRERIFVLAYRPGEQSVADAERGGWGAGKRDDDARESHASGASAWPLAHADRDGFAREWWIEELPQEGQIAFGNDLDGYDGAQPGVGDTNRERLQEQRGAVATSAQFRTAERSGDMGYSARDGRGEGWAESAWTEGRPDVVESGIPLFPPGPADRDAWRRILERTPHLEPAVRRVADELADRMGRRGFANRSGQLRLLGNGVVPLTAAVAFVTLWHRLMED